MLFARRAAVQGQLHLTIPVTDEGSLLETAYPVASVTVSGYAERYADALMFFPIIGIITGYLGDFVKSFPWIIAFSLGTSLIYAVTVVPSLEVKYIKTARATGDSRFVKI